MQFAGAIVALFAFKLWLVHGEEIVGAAGAYDSLWYLRSASHWYWGSPYSWLAFIRPCAYPLWLASVHLLGIPLRLAIELLQFGGAVMLVIGLRSAGVGRFVCFAVLAAICLHPAGFQLNDYTVSDTFYAGVLWFVIGGLLLSAAKQSAWITVVTGIAIAVLWNTREESLLLAAMIGIWAVVLFANAKSAGSSTQKALQTLVRPVGMPLSVAAVVILCVYTINYSVFGSFARSEMTARSFQSLFHSLIRIRPATEKRFVPITTDTLHRAFEVSPTFAMLKTPLDGSVGDAWRAETHRQVGVSGEIGVGWIVWAIRQAASEVGWFETDDRARHSFEKAAREIDHACDSGTLPSRFVIDGFLDPLAQSGALGAIPGSIRHIDARFFARWKIKSLPDQELLTQKEARFYDEMTGRRSAGVPPRDDSAFFLERLIGRYHIVVLVLLHLGAVAAVTAALLFRRKEKTISSCGSAIILIASAVFVRFTLLVWMDATAWDASGDRFLFPILPLWTAVVLLIVGCASKKQPAATPVK